MTEQLDLFAGATPVVPTVPTVTYHPCPARRFVRVEARERCGHCVMNVQRWHDQPASIPQWTCEADVIVLRAILLITQRDGSTLYLCAQHALEHEERGRRDG